MGVSAFSASSAVNEVFKDSEKARSASACIFNTSWRGRKVIARKVEISRKLQQRAEQMIPGGVNSPVRAFRAVGGDAPFIVRGQGSHIFAADGNESIDSVVSWGPLILGHAPAKVIEAIMDAACNGTTFGA